MERVVFTGWQDPESFYRDASILCLTSDFEGWGMVLTEAMTFGAVPVAFNSYAAITDIIDDGKPECWFLRSRIRSLPGNWAY